MKRTVQFKFWFWVTKDLCRQKLFDLFVCQIEDIHWRCHRLIVTVQKSDETRVLSRPDFRTATWSGVGWWRPNLFLILFSFYSSLPRVALQQDKQKQTTYKLPLTRGLEEAYSQQPQPKYKYINLTPQPSFKLSDSLVFWFGHLEEIERLTRNIVSVASIFLIDRDFR